MACGGPFFEKFGIALGTGSEAPGGADANPGDFGREVEEFGEEFLGRQGGEIGGKVDHGDFFGAIIFEPLKPFRKRHELFWRIVGEEDCAGVGGEGHCHRACAGAPGHRDELGEQHLVAAVDAVKNPDAECEAAADQVVVGKYFAHISI